MTEHTEAPWEYRDIGHVALVWGGPVIDAVNGERRDCVAYNVGNAANGRLIAAAPDLLAACDELIQAMVRYEMDVDGEAPFAHKEMMRRARAAIRKATGDA